VTLSFTWLRYGLIVIPALGSLFLAAIPSYSIYTLDILLFLWLTQIRDKWLANRFQPLFIALETGSVGWLSYQFPSSLLFLLIYSTLLICYTLRDSKLRYFLMTLQFAVLLSSVGPHGTSLLFVSALLYLVCGILLFHAQSASTGKIEVEQLYDQLRRKHYELDEAGKRIIDYAKKVGDLAQMEERSRISGDIHDDLGHKLIRLKMMMEAIIRIIDKQPEKGMDLLLQVRDQLTESMETLRSTVRRLKPNEANSKKYTLASLIEDLVQNCGIAVSFNTTGRLFRYIQVKNSYFIGMPKRQ
jgi:two-component system NarL family sensor kinase